MPKLTRSFAINVSIVILTTLVAFVIAKSIPLFGLIQNQINDLQIAEMTPVQPPHPDIVVVTVNEDTLRALPYREPLDRELLFNLLTALADKGVKAVGLDILFDQPTEPAKDTALAQLIRDYPIPLVISYVTTRDGLTDEQQRYLDEFVPLTNRGMANALSDPQHDIVRSIYPGRQVPGLGYVPSFTHALLNQLGIPTERQPRMIHWRRGQAKDPYAFKTFPAQTVPFLPASWLAGKIVLVGYDLQLVDRHPTPFSVVDDRIGPSGKPGIIIHAHGLATLLDDPLDANMPVLFQFALVLGVAGIGWLLGRPGISTWLQIAGMVAGFIAIVVGSFVLFRAAGIFSPVVESALALLFANITTIAYSGHSEREQKRLVKQAFSRYLSKELVDQLTRDPSRLTRSAERKELTFLFTDVEGFTTVCEATDPASLAPLLNAYLDGVCSAVIRNGGMIVDLIGDSVFAMFGAPVDYPDQTVRAMRTALEAQQFTAAFRDRPDAQACNFGRTRIGIHAGAAQVGNFGSEDRFKYVPLGDAVNTGSRIEGLNKYFLTTTCVSDAAIEKFETQLSESNHGLRDELKYRPIGYVVMKGKSRPMLIHELMGRDHPMVTHLDAYRLAFQALEERDSDVARTRFSALHETMPEDYLVRMHLKRLEEGKTDAVIVMDKK